VDAADDLADAAAAALKPTEEGTEADDEEGAEEGRQSKEGRETAITDAGAKYERERAERIARNRAVMKSLGIDSSKLSRGEGGGKGEGGGRNGHTAREGGDEQPGQREARRRAKAARASAAAAATAAAPRRSSRASRHIGGFTDRISKDAFVVSGLPANPSGPSAAATEAADSGTFDDSSVLRYACGGAGGRGGARGRARAEGAVVMRDGGCLHNGPTTRGSIDGEHGGARSCDVDGDGGGSGDRKPGDILLGFAQIPAVFVDEATKKGFYSLDATDGGVHGGGLHHGHTASGGGGGGGENSRPLIVGGGDGGRVSIFGMAGIGGGGDDEEEEGKGARDDDKEKEEEEEEKEEADVGGSSRRTQVDEAGAVLDGDGCRREYPLMSWVAHRGWCSQVQFIPAAAAAAAAHGNRGESTRPPLLPPRLLTAGGMDGVVTLWDVSKSKPWDIHPSPFTLNPKP
jgi:hypothetical protein